MLDKLKTGYRRYPLPHIKIENFFEQEFFDKILSVFPLDNSPIWSEYGRRFKIEGVADKLECSNYSIFPTFLQLAFDYLKSEHFIKSLEIAIDIKDLIYDNNLYGGGINLVPNGGILKDHADFNYNSELELYRAINLLIYFGEEWKKSYGGVLKLYHEDYANNIIEILPTANTCIIFPTNYKTIHGYNKISHPKNEPRRSINIYYYTQKPQTNIKLKPHKTRWI